MIVFLQWREPVQRQWRPPPLKACPEVDLWDMHEFAQSVLVNYEYKFVFWALPKVREYWTLIGHQLCRLRAPR